MHLVVKSDPLQLFGQSGVVVVLRTKSFVDKTLIALVATLALGCVPSATNAFAAVHSAGHASAGYARVGHALGGRAMDGTARRGHAAGFARSDGRVARYGRGYGRGPIYNASIYDSCATTGTALAMTTTGALAMVFPSWAALGEVLGGYGPY